MDRIDGLLVARSSPEPAAGGASPPTSISLRVHVHVHDGCIDQDDPFEEARLARGH